MTSAGFLKQLRKLLQEGDWQPVLSALRLDPLVWDALQDEQFCQRALESCASEPEEWNPARLGLLKLGTSLDFRLLREKPVSQLDPDLAAQLLTLSTTSQEPLSDLGTALLTALLALEKYYQSGQWQRALADIFDHQAVLAPCVMACLIPIAPDPVVMLSSFLSGNLFPEQAERRSLLTHAILANPLDTEQQIDMLVRVLTTLPEDGQLDTLAWLKQNNLSKIASLVAERLLGKGKSQNQITDKDELQPEDKLANIDMVYTQAMLQKISGKVDESKLTLTRGLDLLKTRQDKLLDALELIDKPATPAVPTAQDGMISSGGNTDNEQLVVDAQQMVNNISLQIQAGEYEQAGNLLTHAQQLFPNDPEISRLRAELSRHNGRSIEAIDALQTAVMLKPDDLSLRKTLAATYEERGAWQDALDERMSFLKYFPTPPEQELLSVAATAIRANQLGVAETACHTILELQPENGQANAIYGELLHAKGEDEKALLHLTRATTLSPDLPAPWLVISRIYRDQGNDTFSNDTLKAAAQVLPDSPEIQFALGENCLANSSPSEALVYLRKAYKYDPSSPAISLRLGENLTALGLYDEADRILANARQTRATDPELALIHSKALLGLGEADQALDTITIALEAETQNTSILSILSEIFENVINENKNLAQVLASHPKLNGLIGHVLSTLETAISDHPSSLDLQMLAADLLAETGSPEQAISLYQNLLQKLPYKHEAQWRAQFGLGRIALRLGQLGAALVALKEASQLMPERSDILKSLAETYRSANLPREALETSHAVVALGTGNADGYLWQADLCLKLGDAAEAATAIEKALALDPGRPEFILMHAQALQASGSPEPALARLDELSARQELDPGNLIAAANLYTLLGNRTKSRTCLQKAVAKSENPNAGLLASLADAYAVENQPEEALQSLDQALAIDPENEVLVIQRCKLLERLGRSSDAREYLLTILESPRAASWSNELVSQMQARLAELLREGGDPNGALKYATQALTLDPDNQSIRHLLLQLQRACLLLSGDTLQVLV
ncbi:MAG: tetratricopeptide repeat protein, partial [Anaerolineaceae bacterium]